MSLQKRVSIFWLPTIFRLIPFVRKKGRDRPSAGNNNHPLTMKENASVAVGNYRKQPFMVELYMVTPLKINLYKKSSKISMYIVRKANKVLSQ